MLKGMKSKLIISTIVVIVALIFVISGCAPKVAPTTEETTAVEETKVEETTPTTEAPKEKVTVKMLFLAGGLNKLAPEIEKKFYELWPDTNIKIESEFADYPTLHDKIAITEAGGAGAYDIYWVITDWMPELIDAGFLEPLNSYLESDPIDGWPDTYPAGVLELQTVDNIIYGLPGHNGPYMLFYRTDLFSDETEKANFKAKYGYELAPPETWEQFKQIADFFTRPNQNLYGTSFAGNDAQATPYDIVQVAHNFGAKYWDDAGYPTFNSETWVKALEFLGTMYKENSPKGAEALDMMGRADRFKEGIITMYADWTGFAGYFELAEGSNVVGKVGYSLMPKGGDQGNRDSLNIYWCYSLSASSKHKSEAWQVLKVLTLPEIDQLWTLGGMGGIGVRKSTVESQEVLKQFPFYKTMGEILDGNAFGSPFNPVTAKIYDELKKAVQNYLAGQGNAQEVLDKANDEIAKAIMEMK
ncbi:MAG: sugar ABC transporter substrate-binding protein [Actinobacteria bacterium]|nr:sugar ABC transporter substrate-binding protein [Actinomycetota bacterium]